MNSSFTQSINSSSIGNNISPVSFGLKSIDTTNPPVKQTQDIVGMTGNISSHIEVSNDNLENVSFGSSTPVHISDLSENTVSLSDFLTLKKQVINMGAMARMQSILISNFDKELSSKNDEITVLRSDITFLKSQYNELINANDVNEQVKKLRTDAIIPTRANPDDACKDLYALYTVKKVTDENGITHDVESEDMIVPPHSNLLIKTGIALAWNNPSYYVQLWTRSGLAYKNKLIVQAGVIDISYRQDVGVLLYNGSDVPFVVKKGDRIAQYNYNRITINEKSEVVEEFTIPKNSERNGGFGSTGI